MNNMELETAASLLDSPKTYKLYRKRWYVLVAYCMLSLAVVPTSTCFTAISNILQFYYDVQPIAIHMVAGVFLPAVMLFNLPASLLLHKFGLAFILKTAAFLNLSGAIIRYFAYEEEHGYYLLLAGNSLSALSLASYMFLPTTLALNWFGKHENGKVVGIGIGFDMLSVGIGFLHTTLVISNNKDTKQIKRGLKSVLLHQLIAAIAATVIMLFVKSKPKTPPSKDMDEIQKPVKLKVENSQDQTRILDESTERRSEHSFHTTTFWECIKSLLKHRSFLIIIQITAITASLEISFEIILNDILINIFPGREKEIGIVGFSAVVLGFVSNVLFGIIVGKTKAYKTVTAVIFSLSAICLIIWTILLEVYHSFILISIAFCGFVAILTGYYSVANIHIVVITHPIDPGTSTMLSMIAQSIFGLIISITVSYTLVKVRVLYVNIIALFIIFSALFLSNFIKTHNKETEELVNISLDNEL